MKLISFKGTGIHNQFNFDINFFKNISILFGINGSGKTTVLKIINYMINARFDELKLIHFVEIKLTFMIDNKEFFYKINKIEKYKNSQKSLENFVPNGGHNRDFILIDKNQIESIINIVTDNDELNLIFEQFNEIEQNHRYQNEEYFNIIQRVRKRIQQVFNCNFVSIERKAEFYTQNEIEEIEFPDYVFKRTGEKILNLPSKILSRLEEEFFHSYRNRNEITNPSVDKSALMQVIRFIKENYMQNYRYSSSLDATFQRESYEKLFQFDDLIELKASLMKITIAELEKQKKSINDQRDFFKKNFKFQIQYDETKIDFLIKNLLNEKAKIKEKDEISSDYLINFIQFIKLNHNSELLGEINRKKAKKEEPIKILIEKLNLFFKDTKKVANIDQNGKISFQINSKQSIQPEDLSSGEQQLLIFFTYLIIQGQAKKEPIMLYDEPELSLHLDWQEKLIDTILEINPSIQIILATHSPAIGSNYLKKQINISKCVK